MPVRIWRLTRRQYNNTVAELLGDTSKPADAFEPESSNTGFLNDERALGVTKQFMSQASAAAQTLAAQAMSSRLASVFPAGEASLADGMAVKGWVAAFGRKAFRRPLAPGEVDAYFKLYTDAAPKLGPKTSVQVIIEAFLQSQHFLFRTELGQGKADARGRVLLTPHEVASSLSYYLTSGPPDAELDAAADAGTILNRVELEKQARRLLQTPRAAAMAWDFFGQVLNYSQLEELEAKTGAGGADFAAAKNSLARETQTFIAELMKGDGAFATLVAGNHTYVDSALAKLYGVAGPGTGQWAKVTLDGKDRAGVLTHMGMMAMLSHPDQSSPVLRGKFVVERVLCQELADPPPGLNVDPPKVEGAKTTRQRYAAFTEAPGTQCVACHKTLNAPGYLLEHLDWMGKVRRDEGGVPLDTGVEIMNAGDADGRYANIGDFAAKLASSAHARGCMTKQLFRYATGTHEQAGDSAALASLNDAFGRAGWTIPGLMLGYVLSDTFVVRKTN